MRVESTVTTHPAPEWDDCAMEVSEYTVSIPGLETMELVLPGEPRRLVVSVDERASVGLHARWAAGPPSDPASTLQGVLRGDLPSPSNGIEKC